MTKILIGLSVLGYLFFLATIPWWFAWIGHFVFDILPWPPS